MCREERSLIFHLSIVVSEFDGISIWYIIVISAYNSNSCTSHYCFDKNHRIFYVLFHLLQ
jgi:hypothetical protein